MDHTTIFAPPSDNSHIPNRYLHLTTNRIPSLATDPSNGNPYHCPASRAAIASLENIKVNSSFLEKDPNSCCQICKKEFVLDLEIKMFPCKHVFHSECILQWLETKNTCPVCQFELPTQEDEDYDMQGLPRGENFIGTIIAEELLNDEEETEEDLVHPNDPPTPVSVMPNLTMRNRWLPRGENFFRTTISEELLNAEEEDLMHFHDPPTRVSVMPNLTMRRGEDFARTIISEAWLDYEVDFMQFQDPRTPIAVMPNLTMMNDWWLDITVVNHFMTQSRDTLVLTNVTVSSSEIMDCLLISFNQLVMDSEFESVDLMHGENGYGVGEMADRNV